MSTPCEPLTIQFLSPEAMIPDRERCSKLLDPNSALYAKCQELRHRLELAYPDLIADQRMDFHIEVERGYPTSDPAIATARAQTLTGKVVEPIPVAWKKAIVLDAPEVEGYGPTHITLGYFEAGQPAPLTEIQALIVK